MEKSYLAFPFDLYLCAFEKVAPIKILDHSDKSGSWQWGDLLCQLVVPWMVSACLDHSTTMPTMLSVIFYSFKVSERLIE